MIGGISGVGGFGMGSVGAFYQSRLTENIRNARAAQQAQQNGQGLVGTVRKSASPETPVEPVRAVRPVSREEVSLPELTSRLENDPAAMAGRMRTRYGEVGPDGVFVETGKSAPEQAEIPGLPDRNKENAAPEGGPAQGVEGAREAAEEGRCETCEKRKYQDGSDDPGVSFKTPTNIKPEQAAAAVRGHEMEHVVREQAKAGREGRKVVSQSVAIHTEICPECGKAYVSGGTTRTVTRADTDNAAQQEQQENQRNQEDQNTSPKAAA